MTKIKIYLALLSAGLFSSCADMEQAMTQLNKDLSKLSHATSPRKTTTSHSRQCPHCNGDGKIRDHEFRSWVECGGCGGKGY